MVESCIHLDYIFINLNHLGPHAFDSGDLLLCGGLRDAAEYLHNIQILLFNFSARLIHLSISPLKLKHVLRLLNVLQTLNKSVGEAVHPLDKCRAHLDQGFTDLRFPNLLF